MNEKDIQTLTSDSKKEQNRMSNEKISRYPKNSNAAALNRLKNGSDDFSDKWRIHKKTIIILYVVLFLPALFLYYSCRSGGSIASLIGFLIVMLVLVNYPLYFLYIKDYDETKTDSNFHKEKTSSNIDKSTPSVENNDIESFNVYKSQINDLKKLYEVKEKIAKELIEKRFEPPQITYDKFISSVDSCTELFNNQADVALNMINLATGHDSKMDYEIETRINIMKSIIEKIDSLTNALVINIGQTQSEESEHINELLDDMENLIDSIKEYK